MESMGFESWITWRQDEIFGIGSDIDLAPSAAVDAKSGRLMTAKDEDTSASSKKINLSPMASSLF